MTVALVFAGMLNSFGVDSQVYAPSLSSHWPSCMEEAATSPVRHLSQFAHGEWHVPSKHVAEASALAATVPAIRDVFEDAGARLEWMHGVIEAAARPTSPFPGPLCELWARSWDAELLTTRPRQRSRSPRRGSVEEPAACGNPQLGRQPGGMERAGEEENAKRQPGGSVEASGERQNPDDCNCRYSDFYWEKAAAMEMTYEDAIQDQTGYCDCNCWYAGNYWDNYWELRGTTQSCWERERAREREYAARVQAEQLGFPEPQPPAGGTGQAESHATVESYVPFAGIGLRSPYVELLRDLAPDISECSLDRICRHLLRV